MKVAFHTLGCKVNQNDTESLMTLFQERGYEVVPFGSQADIYVVNTCAVTQTGAGKSRQMIRKAVGFRPAVVVATGCYPQVSPEEAAQIEGVNLLVGMAERPKIVDLVEEYLTKHTNRLTITEQNDTKWVNLPHSHTMDRTRATLKIEEGCDQFCSYCIIPYARGRVRSMPLEMVRNEFKKLLSLGYKEIVLTGIHLGCYGKDLGLTLADALDALLALEGDFRIRLGSIEPTDFDERLISLVRHPKVCQYLHIPLQSGSDSVLHRMKRDYDLAYYRDLINRLRAGNPLLGIGTDLIVGFPGETEENFRETVEFLEWATFSRIHVFRYSPRKGTPAAAMPGRIPKSVQEERSHQIIQLAQKTSLEYESRFLDRMVEVLFEEEKDGVWAGLSSEYLTVKVKSDHKLKNCLSPVRVIGIAKDYLIGVLGTRQ